jgi:hypothetical protein
MICLDYQTVIRSPEAVRENAEEETGPAIAVKLRAAEKFNRH